METVETLIIGGGLSGLHAASLLHRNKISFVVLEARSRIGGRILSRDYEGFFSDLGPSWYWPEINPKLTDLIQRLGLRGYRQFEKGRGCFQDYHGTVRPVRGYTTTPASWRISGGMTELVTRIAKSIPETALRLSHPVCEIEQTSDGVLVSVGILEQEPWARFKAGTVILALPPRLAAATILFTPDLSHHLTQAMLRMGTWMAGQAKFCALYDKPYWRDSGLSGQAFSQRGPVGEIHDGSSESQGPYGLTGFISVPAVQRNHERSLMEAILSQLATIYGKPAGKPLACYYQDWAREKFTATGFDQPMMREHPLYQPPAGKASIWKGVLQFAGSETADEYGGYLEGAVGSAERAVKDLLRKKSDEGGQCH